ncbi:MAG: hypothetical protein ACFFDH_24025, partial [Promethearchaeota archaeon]
MNLITNQNMITNPNDDNNMNFKKENLELQDLAIDNTYSGIGIPWNVTHWANRTDYNLDVSFTNSSYDTVEIPLGSGWEGYKLKTNINDLTDSRNWCNGSFNYGTDNGYTVDENDTTFISNKFQNWTFGEFDLDDDSDMSGNYLDSTSNNPDTEDHDCLELRITGFLVSPPDNFGYDGQDRCYWTSSIKIPRGGVVDSELKFDVRDHHLMPSNDFELRISINDQQVYSIGGLNLMQACGDAWRTFSIPQALWT